MIPLPATDGVYATLLDLAAAATIIAPPAVVGPTTTAPGSNGQPAAGVPAAGDGDPLGLDRSICELLHLDVLGERPDRSVALFAQGKLDTIPRISQFKFVDLLQVCGPVVREHVHQSAEAHAPDTHHFERVREAIAVLAGQQRLRDTTIRGAGIWPGDGGRLVLAGAREAAVWDPQTRQLERTTRPKAAGLLLDLDSGRPWYNFDQLAADLIAADDPAWRQSALDELYVLLALWHWRAPGAGSLLAGLMLATWLQTAWRWRPHVALTGESVAGKSTFLTALNALFGPLGHLVNKPSEAGLRQTIHGRACAILIDEFESDSHRRRVLELLRTSGTGSRIVRGTTGQGGIEFGLRHICWIGAVEVGTDRQPDANRYLTLEMLKPTERHRRGFRLPTDDDLAALGRRLLAVAVWASGAAIEAAGRLRGRETPGLDPRTVESLAVPTSMLVVTMGLSDAEAGELLEFLGGQIERDAAGQESDQEQLLQTILGSSISLERGQQATVAQLLTRTTGGFGETFEPLERVGVAIATDSNAPREFAGDRTGLFLDCKTIRRYLLRDTQWADQQIETILLRLSTARRARRRVAGQRQWGIEVDWQWLAKTLLDEDTDKEAESLK